MKNLKTYVSQEVSKRTNLPEVANEITQRIIMNVEKNFELGNIKVIDKNIVDEIIFKVFNLYY
jgi:hypothetical protein